MGVDIHMSVINAEGAYKAREIYNGRNSEWFANLNGDEWDDIYDTFPAHSGIPQVVPEEIRLNYDNCYDYGYYGFRYLSVGEFLDWFSEKRPDIDAGWVTSYEKWLYEKKNITPNNLPHYMPEDVEMEDLHFIEVENTYDNSRWLHNFLRDREDIQCEDYIVYYFDH